MGNLLTEQPDIVDIHYAILGENGILSTLTIIMADPSHAGGYVCIATNAAGQATATAELTIHGKCPSINLHGTATCIATNAAWQVTAIAELAVHYAAISLAFWSFLLNVCIIATLVVWASSLRFNTNFNLFAILSLHSYP